MKKVNKHTVFLMILFTLCSSSCLLGSSTQTSVSPMDGNCRDFMCVEISIAEPITLNQPADVTINILSSKDEPDLVASLIALPGGSVEYSPVKVWNFDAKAEQTLTFKSSVTFTEPGGWQVSAQVAFIQGGFIVADLDRVIIDEDGTAYLNPTPGPGPTSDVLQPPNSYP